MKIVVCVKQVPDTKGGVKFKPDGTLDRAAMLTIMNPDDKAGLEAALRLKDQYGAEVTVVTMGLPKAEEVLREAMAMGADNGILVTDRVLGGADTWATSQTIAGALRNLDYDLIITGRQAIDGDTAQVGPQISEHLGLPVISYAEGIEIDGDSVIVKRQFDDRYMMLKAKMPCLITALSELNEPRYMTPGGIFDAFLKQLEELHKMLAEMGLLCEKMIDGTYEALMNMDRELAAKILQDDANVDLKERDIESKCLKLLLEQQPVASDLRKISSALKMITDLERIGDQAGDIAEIIKTTDLLEPVKATRLGEMAKAVASMVRESIESFANEDLRKTKEVIAYDDVIDDMFSQVKKELADGILNGEATQEQILDILMIAKYYERIGDHATNIAEWAEYAITGIHRNSELEEHL